MPPVTPRPRYSPAMPKAQFLQQRPGGDYQKYLSYLARNRPGWNPQTPYVSQRIAPPTRGPIPTYASLLSRINFLSPQAQMSQANRMAQQSVSSQQAMIQSDYAQRMKEAMAQQLASQAAGRAAAAMNAQLMGLVGSGYSGAADEVRAIRGSLGAAMAGASAADVAAAGATAGNVGAPAPSVGAGSPIAGPAQEGVEVFRGAELPAEALGTAGTSAQTGLGGLIGAQNLRATQEAQAAYMQALGDAQNARTAAIKELAAGRTQNAAAYLDQLQSHQRDAVALAMSLIGQQRAAGAQAFGQKATTRQLNQRSRQIAQAGRQQGISKRQWAAAFREKRSEFKQTLEQHRKDTQKQIDLYKARAQASGKAITPRQVMGQYVAGLGQSAYDPKFQSAIASIYYGSPSVAQAQPVRGSRDDKARTNAVISYLINSAWPSISANVKPRNQAALRAEFEQELRAWFANAPLPGLQAWKLQQIKG